MDLSGTANYTFRGRENSDGSAAVVTGTQFNFEGTATRITGTFNFPARRSGLVAFARRMQATVDSSRMSLRSRPRPEERRVGTL